MSEPVRRTRKLVALVFLAVLAIAAAISATRRTAPDRSKLPVPNGFDDLVRAGTLIRGDWPKPQGIDQVDPSILRSLVETNRSALDLARVGLGRECLVHFPDSEAGLSDQIDGQHRLKDMARLLAVEGLVARSDGRFGDASRNFREAMQVGQILTQGGMLTDAQLGWSLMKINADRLRTIRDQLSKDDLKATILALGALDAGRIPALDVVERWERWFKGAFNPFQRSMFRWNGIHASERISQIVQARKAHDNAERSLRFLMVELTIHAFHSDRNAWPRSVRELVPAYLASVPTDPANGQALAYPANASGELTDDLSQIARPDGEVVPVPDINARPPETR